MFLVLMIEVNLEKYDSFLKIITSTYDLIHSLTSLLWKASYIITACDLADTQKTKWSL